MWGDQALRKLVNEYDFETVLDIGCGAGEQARVFLEAGKSVTGIDFDLPEIVHSHWKGIKGDFYNEAYPWKQTFDLIWSAHVLEHQMSPGAFLAALHALCHENTIICITVPPLKHQIVTGHLTLWNGGLLMYHLVLAGFDCSKIRIRQYDYNISAILKYAPIDPPGQRDNINTMSAYMPNRHNQHGFSGDIKNINW